MPDKWAQYAVPAGGDKWAQYAETGASSTAEPDTRNGIQKAFDESTAPLSAEDRKGVPDWLNEAADVPSGFINGLGSLAVHPWESVKGVANAFVHPMDTAKAAGNAFSEHPGYTIGQTIGGAFGTLGAGEGTLRGAGKLADISGVREAALGNPDEAAMRGLHVSPQSPKALRTLSAVGGARPFLQGVKGLEDLQARVPMAKQEIWAPMEETLNRVGGKEVPGPNGPTTLRDLENRRLEISAQLRALKSGGPEAMALAQQKGLTQAGFRFPTKTGLLWVLDTFPRCLHKAACTLPGRTTLYGKSSGTRDMALRNPGDDRPSVPQSCFENLPQRHDLLVHSATRWRFAAQGLALFKSMDAIFVDLARRDLR